MPKVRGSLNASISGKRDKVSLAHNGSGVFGANRPFLASTSCVKVFRSKLKPMRFHGLHSLQMLESGKTSFGAKVV